MVTGQSYISPKITEWHSVSSLVANQENLHYPYLEFAQKFFKRTVAVGLYKNYKGDIGELPHENCLLPQHIYEIDGVKMFYLYNYSNAHKFNIIYTLRSDNHSLKKLFKYKILQLKSEEEEHLTNL